MEQAEQNPKCREVRRRGLLRAGQAWRCSSRCRSMHDAAPRLHTQVPARYLQSCVTASAGARQLHAGSGALRHGAGTQVSAGGVAGPTASPLCLDAHLEQAPTAKRQPQQRQPKSHGSGAGDTAPFADASAPGRHPRARVAVGTAAGPGGGSLISPGSERSPGASSSDGGGTSSGGSLDLLQPRRHRAGARGAAAAVPAQPQPRMGMSVETGMAVIASAAAGVAPCAAAAERRRQLEEYRQQRAAAAAARQEQVGKPGPTAGIFRQPASRPPGSVSRATAANCWRRLLQHGAVVGYGRAAAAARPAPQPVPRGCSRSPRPPRWQWRHPLPAALAAQAARAARLDLQRHSIRRQAVQEPPPALAVLAPSASRFCFQGDDGDAAAVQASGVYGSTRQRQGSGSQAAP